MATKNPPVNRKPKTRVLLVDDHAILRQGLMRLINQEADMEVCGEAEDAAKAFDAVNHLKPDVAVVDISLKGSNGIELIKNIKARHPDLAVLVLSMHDESLYAERCLRAGALGYMTKLEATEKVLVAIRQVLSGQIYLSAASSARIVHKMVGKSITPAFAVDRLTDRELEVFQLLGRGLRTRQIAEELHLGTKSVETYRARIKEKLKLVDSTDLLLHAIRWVHSLGGEKL